jgi:DNA polymerase elongation subunit (family B)
MTKPKIVIWDLEIIPDAKNIMRKTIELYNGATMGANLSTIICFGYKVLGDKKAKCINAWDFPKRWKKDVNDDYEVVKAAYEVLKDADAIVTHYGKKFDLPHLNSRLMYHGFPPLPNIPHIDTFIVAKYKLKLHRRKLDTIAEFFGLERKMSTGGWELWVEVMNRKKSSCAKMAKYCKQDCEVLEKVYLKLRPLMTHIPNHNLFNDKDHQVCPNCGSKRVQKHGLRHTKTATQQRYRCLDCGSCSSKPITKSGKGMLR